jgi:hypothetical protein
MLLPYGRNCTLFKHEVCEEDALLRAYVSDRNRMIQEKRVYLEVDKTTGRSVTIKTDTCMEI